MGSPSPNESSTSVSQLFARACDGDRDAFGRLLMAHFPWLVGLARKTLGRRAAGVLDADDAVQSAVTEVWRRIQQGKFSPGRDRNELWRLLAVFTRRKALKHLRREDAAKRGGGQVVNASAVVNVDGEPMRLEDHPGLATMPAAEFDLHSAELLQQLDAELRYVAVLKLSGRRNQEIADLLNRSVTHVERKLAMIRSKWKKLYPAGDEP